LPLATVLGPFLTAPLRLVAFEEHGDTDYPRRIALRAVRD
jgi:hypothetical protein